MEATSRHFRQNAHKALGDTQLQEALGNVQERFVGKRRTAVEKLPEFEALRENATHIRNHTLEHLDLYLEYFERQVKSHGGHVHYAVDAHQACEAVTNICLSQKAKRIAKGKSMVSEEIGLNEALSRHGISAIETDLGEYIIQLRGEHPSHIIAPALHLNRNQVEKTFKAHHSHLNPQRNLNTVDKFLEEARSELRQKFISADIGITGANFLIAETGLSVLVTNEGNGDLSQILPKTHIVLASIEKLVPTLEDASQLLRLMARSATGQEISVYTTFSGGPRRPQDKDGPENYHVILLDNGRSSMLGGPFQEMLRCIRCGACMNHCPVYHSVGGHAYGWIYPGPMGSVLTPALIGIENAAHLPNASTLCGRCEEVCPVKIPLPKMLRHWREKQFERHLNPAPARWGLKLWSFFASRPKIYHIMASVLLGSLAALTRNRASTSWLPFTASWTRHREMILPASKTFQQQWRDRHHDS